MALADRFFAGDLRPLDCRGSSREPAAEASAIFLSLPEVSYVMPSIELVDAVPIAPPISR